MRYKIVEKASGEVHVYAERFNRVGISGQQLPAAIKDVWSFDSMEWERLPVLFLCWDDAYKHVHGLKELAKLDEIKREEIIDV